MTLFHLSDGLVTGYSDRMFLNIITPCIRPEYLFDIENSINIPREQFRWIVVFDSESIPDNIDLPESAEVHAHRKAGSVNGSQQRNFGLSLIKHGHVYFNDDDTTLHESLWDNLVNNFDHDFISFDQLNSDLSFRLYGRVIEPGRIDTHTFVVSRKLVAGTTWVDNEFCDGIFAKQCYSRARNPLYIHKYLSVYNSLR